MKILFTSHRFNPDIGGIEVNSEILARFFCSRGHHVKLVTQSIGKSTSRFPCSVIRRPSACQLIRLYLWADIVYQNNVELGTLWPGLFIPRPIVISVRTWIRGHKGRVRWIDKIKKLALRRADAVIAISNAIRKDSFLASVVIGNPYRSTLFRIIPEISRQNSVVFLGRLVSDKGAELLVKAYSLLAFPAMELTIVGAGPEESSLRKLALTLGVKARFAGELVGDDLVRELNRHTIMVVPSLWEEPFGNVALEGMACGCVVLASNGGGLPDAVGSAGLLFERGNYHDLADKLERLMNDKKIITNLTNKSSIHLSRHHQDVVAQKYLDILIGVARGRAYGGIG